GPLTTPFLFTSSGARPTVNTSYGGNTADWGELMGGVLDSFDREFGREGIVIVGCVVSLFFAFRLYLNLGSVSVIRCDRKECSRARCSTIEWIESGCQSGVW